jgi:hypothetical protein
MTRLSNHRIIPPLAQKLLRRLRLLHILYLLGVVAVVVTLGWMLIITQMLFALMQPQTTWTAALPSEEATQSAQAPETLPQGPVTGSLQPETASPKPQTTVVGSLTAQTLHKTGGPHKRLTPRGHESEASAEDTSPSDHVGVPSTAGRPSAWSRSAPSHSARALLIDLLRIPPEFGTEINQTLADLVRYGDEAVEAIRALLNAQDDDNDTGLSGLYGVDPHAARLRLINALDLIGSRKALDTLVHTLHSTTQPTEIALLAKSVEAHAPGEYREDILTAAQATLGLTAANLKEVSRMLGNIQPLLTVYAAYGDAATVPDLEAAWSRLPAFSTVALGGLPDGAGINSLIQFVNDPKVPERRKNFPVQILAQASRIYPDVGETLVAMAKAKQLTGPAWAALAMALGGTETVLRTSIPVQSTARSVPGQSVLGAEEKNPAGLGSAVQILYQPAPSVAPSGSEPSLAYLNYNSKAPATWTDAEIDQQLALIDQLLATEPSSDAVAALRKAHQSLSAWQQIGLINGERKPL